MGTTLKPIFYQGLSPQLSIGSLLAIIMQIRWENYFCHQAKAYFPKPMLCQVSHKYPSKHGLINLLLPLKLPDLKSLLSWDNHSYCYMNTKQVGLLLGKQCSFLNSYFKMQILLFDYIYVKPPISRTIVPIMHDFLFTQLVRKLHCNFFPLIMTVIKNNKVTKN